MFLVPDRGLAFPCLGHIFNFPQVRRMDRQHLHFVPGQADKCAAWLPPPRRADRHGHDARREYGIRVDFCPLQWICAHSDVQLLHVQRAWCQVADDASVHHIVRSLLKCSSLGSVISLTTKIHCFRGHLFCSVQIMQFYTGIFVHWSLYSAEARPEGACAKAHPGLAWCFYLQLVYVIAVLLFFSHFFVQQYMTHGKSA